MTLRDLSYWYETFLFKKLKMLLLIICCYDAFNLQTSQMIARKNCGQKTLSKLLLLPIYKADETKIIFPHHKVSPHATSRLKYRKSPALNQYIRGVCKLLLH